MITYCPTCANMLLLELTAASKELRWYCDCCPYEYTITSKVAKTTPLPPKQVEDVLGGDEAWANASVTASTCHHCHHNQAYLRELKMGASDEGATSFFKCLECGAVQRGGG